MSQVQVRTREGGCIHRVRIYDSGTRLRRQQNADLQAPTTNLPLQFLGILLLLLNPDIQWPVVIHDTYGATAVYSGSDVAM